MTTQAVSADGRLVVFESTATTLVAGDTNGTSDVFLRDTVAGTTVRVSEAPGGVQADGFSFEPVISSNGGWIAFSSYAGNLVVGDTNATRDVFLYEVATGVLTRISVDGAGVQGNFESDEPSITADGRYIAFSSLADNLVTGDANSVHDIFVRDRVVGTTTRVSLADDESESTGQSADGAISANGAFVAFTSNATNLVGAGADANGTVDVFRRDLAGATTIRVSVSTGGAESNDYSSTRAGSISADGSRIVFKSYATNLGPDADTDGDVFLRDLTASTTTLVSVATDGTPGDGEASDGSISADGSTVVFVSNSPNLVPGQTTGDPNIYVRRLATAETGIVSSAPVGAPGNNGSYFPAISANATHVAFSSGATNLITGDTNGFEDAFLSTLDYPAPVGGGGASSAGLLPPTGPDAGAEAFARTLATGLIAVGVVAILVARRRPVGRHASR